MFWAMKRSGLAGEVTGYARSGETRETAREIGLCDVVYDDIDDAVRDADLVVLCVPVGVMGQVMEQIAGSLKTGATVTDVGSVKRDVIEQVSHISPKASNLLQGTHLAGTEHSGPRAGFAELFDNRWCLLVPSKGQIPTPSPAAQPLGRHRSNVEEMDAEHHDLVLAVTSMRRT